MADPDAIAARFVMPLASTAVNVVRDAFALDLATEDEFVESDVAIELLEFASTVVGGLAAAADTLSAGAVRSSLKVEVPLADSGVGRASASLTVTLYGPGDVRGLEHAQIVRRFPAPGTQNAEETVLAHIEFDRPELPWAFSAQAQGAVMQPWLTLVVVERASVRWEPSTRALLPVMQVPPEQLPPLARADLWAHAQAPRTGRATEQDLRARLSPAHASVNLSRLISPRVLKQDTDYLAAVVPTTDIGVRGGLGLTGGTLDPAWTSGTSGPVRLPVYDSWEFRTGPNGDFRALALRLQGVVAPYEVGRKLIDTSRPGKPLRALAGDEVGRKQVLRCALYSPTPPPPEHQVAENASWPDDMVDDLRTELDRPASIEGTAGSTGGVPDLPIIGPRIYAKLHRGSTVIEGSDWFAELNLTPMRRIVGGLGTRVVQRDQEPLMQSAWAQLGEVQAANHAIRLAQLAEVLATRLHSRLGRLQTGRLLQVAAPLATRVSVKPGSTLSAEIRASATPIAATGGAFRRVTRPHGPVLRRTDALSREKLGSVVGADGALRDFARLYRNPEGIARLTGDVLQELDLRLVSLATDIPVHAVGGVLTEANARVEGLGGFASYLTDPSRWGSPDVSFDPAGAFATRWGERLLRSPSVPAVESIRAQRTGPLVAELSLSKAADTSPLRDRLRDAAVVLNDRVLDDLAVQPIDVRPIDIGRIDIGRASRYHPGGIGPITRRSPIGGAVGRLRAGANVRVATVGAGRIPVVGVRPVGGIGLRRIDGEHLRELRGTGDVAVRDAGLRQFADLAEVRLTPTLDRMDGLPIELLRAGMTALVDPGELLSIARVPHRETLAIASAQLFATIDPRHTVRAALNGRLRLPVSIAERWFAQPRIAPIAAAPRFDRPMYRALESYDREWLVPGLGLLPTEDFVTVLSTNSEFMAAFFVGLSDEMGRELLWRGYPTDQRGTYFYRFWNPSTDELARPIHAFPRTSLASQIGLGGGDGSAVIVVKSELVRRFPDLVIQAVKNQGEVGKPVFEKPGSPQETARLLFAETLEPDIALVGVDLSVTELFGNDWWILIAEHPSATRFERPGDDELSAGQLHLNSTSTDAATYADRLLHRPVRVAFKATDFDTRGA